VKDPLAPFLAAYRAENSGTALDTRALRERVLTATWRRRKRRLRRVVWLLPIAAVLVGSGALAASAPARRSVARVLAELGWFPAPPVASQPTHHTARRPVALAPPTPAPVLVATAAPATAASLGIAPQIPVEAAPVAVAPATAPAQPHTNALAWTSRRPSSSSLGSTSTPANEAAPESTNGSASAPREQPGPGERAATDARVATDALAADIASYRTAHELHFARADYARALEAWNTYLAQHPAGTFAPEARLNRAVCLARLGKTSEAERALGALATNENAYVSARARRLLARISARR
jgi:hypothetical protein